MVAAVGAGQLAVGWSNDWLDRDQDRARARADKPLARGDLRASTVRNAGAVALMACVPLSLVSGVASALTHILAVGSALAYNAGMKRTPLSAVPYAISFGLGPAVVALGPPLHRWPHPWVMVAGALIGVGGHFAQVLTDIPADRQQGIRGLPQLLGQRASVILAAVLLLAATLLAALAPGPGPVSLVALALAAAGAAGIVAAALAGRTNLAFRLTLGVAVVAVLAFLLSGRGLK
jgi:heme o synthase